MKHKCVLYSTFLIFVDHFSKKCSLGAPVITLQVWKAISKWVQNTGWLIVGEWLFKSSTAPWLVQCLWELIMTRGTPWNGSARYRFCKHCQLAGTVCRTDHQFMRADNLSGAPDGTVLQDIYSADIVSRLAQPAEQIINLYPFWY